MVMKEIIKKTVKEAIRKTFDNDFDIIPVNYSEHKQYGDYSTPVCMSLTKELKRNPREIADKLSNALSENEMFAKVEVAGPGFINFFLADSFLSSYINKLLNDKKTIDNETLKGKDILLEFVSANPTGPLHIGHGRWAAIGDSLANVLIKCGAKVSKEFYINDAGNQITKLYDSVNAVRSGSPIPEDGYHGEYINEIAMLEDDPAKILLTMQKETLARFRVAFDNYFSEKTLHNEERVNKSIKELKDKGYIYESENAVWFKTTEFGDDKDRVLIKNDGEFTYYAVDIAYHRNKLERGYNTLINILGADHHGYVKRLEAIIEAFAHNKVEMKILIGQLVSLYRNGEPVRMSKRTGNIITLDEIIDEIGTDAARYYLVTRKADTPLEFDIEVAKKQSDENPVFYVQYAHARICGILRNADGSIVSEADEMVKKLLPIELIDSPEARDLIIELLKFPEVLTDIGQTLEPHKIPVYLENLAGVFHRFYTNHRVITDDKDTTIKRLILIKATAEIVKIGLDIIGVNAPDSM